MKYSIVFLFLLKSVLINSEFNEGFPGTVEQLHTQNNRRSRLSKDFDDSRDFVPVVPTNFDDKIQNFADTKNLSPEQKVLLKSIVDRAARYGGPIFDALPETNKTENENTGRGNNSKNNKIKSSTTRRPLSSTPTKTTMKRTSTSSSTINKSTARPITDKTTGINKKINKNSTPNVQQALNNIKPSSVPTTIKKPTEPYLSDLSDNVTTAAIIENLSQQTEIAAREDIYTGDRTSTQANNKDKVGRLNSSYDLPLVTFFFFERFLNMNFKELLVEFAILSLLKNCYFIFGLKKKSLCLLVLKRLIVFFVNLRFEICANLRSLKFNKRCDVNLNN